MKRGFIKVNFKEEEQAAWFQVELADRGTLRTIWTYISFLFFSGANVNLIKQDGVRDESILSSSIQARKPDSIRFLVQHLEANVDQELTHRDENKVFTPLCCALEEDLKE